MTNLTNAVLDWNVENLLNCLPLAIIGALLLLTPNLTRRGLLFAVPVSPVFLASDDARHAIFIFRRSITIALAVALLIAYQGRHGPIDALVPVFLLLAAAVLAFYRANRLVAPFRAVSNSERSVDLCADSDRPPLALWLAVGPFVLLAATALFLDSHWNAIPDKVPVHFGIFGEPDRWVAKGIKGVYGPLAFGAELCIWLSLLAFASWFGTRRSTVRSGAITILVGVEYLLAFIASMVPASSLFAIPGWVSLVVVLAPLPIIVAYMIKKAAEPSQPAENMPEDCWKAGVFYYNPNDPALLVEKRTGFGYTINFANKWSWALMAVGAVVVVTGPLLVG